MAERIELQAQKRELIGKSSNSLRKAGILPSVVYGHNFAAIPIQIKYADFEKVFKRAGETGLIELVSKKGSAKDKRTVLIHNVQMNPVSDQPIHADFFQVDLKEKVTADVPVELLGESPAEKAGKGTVVQQLDEVEVTALPADLPDKFSIDISGLLEVDDAILVSELKVDKEKVKIEASPEQIVVKVEPVEEEVEEVEKEAPIEGEAAKEGEGAEKETTGEVGGIPGAGQETTKKE